MSNYLKLLMIPLALFMAGCQGNSNKETPETNEIN